MVRHTKWLLLGVCTLLAGLFLVITSEMLEAAAGEDAWIGRLDHGLLQTLAGVRTPKLNAAAVNLTALGSGTVLTILVSFFAAFFLLLRRYRWALQISLAGLGSMLLTAAFKGHFERARPDSLLHLVDVEGYSYPSGHSLSSGSIYFTLAIICSSVVARHRERALMISLFLTLIIGVAFSRVYLGVHYFSDITAGILLGVAWAALLGSLMMFLNKTRRLETSLPSSANNLIPALVFILFTFGPSFASAQRFEDPTGGKPFLPWLWEDQFKPTLQQTTNSGNLGILAAGAVGSIAAYQYDDDVFEHNRRGENLLMTHEASGYLGTIGGGGLGIGIAIAQLWLDQHNGLMHARAIALTSLSHVTLAYAFQRKRPGGREDYLPFPSSFPSGHASSAFATATSLAYAYGYKAGVPALLVATAIAAGRVSENTHWLSDVVSGAALGIFWARASYQTSREQEALTWVPIPCEDGGILQISLRF